MKSIDALIASHLTQVLRPKQRSPWFETDDELTTELRTIRALAKPPQIVGEACAIGQVTNLLLAHGIDAVVVVDATNTPCGTVTASDVLRARPDWTAADAMSAATVQRATASVGATAELMAREKTLHVVIVEGDQIVGLANALDLLAATCLAPR